MKLFCNMSGTEVWNQIINLGSSSDGEYNLSVTYDGEKTITYTVGDKSVNQNIKGGLNGSFGIVSWNGGGSFNNLMLTLEDDETTSEIPGGGNETTPDIPISGETDSETHEPLKNSGNEKSPTPSTLPIIIGAVSGVAVILAVTVFIIIKKRKK